MQRCQSSHCSSSRLIRNRGSGYTNRWNKKKNAEGPVSYGHSTAIEEGRGGGAVRETPRTQVILLFNVRSLSITHICYWTLPICPTKKGRKKLYELLDISTRQ